MWYSSLHIGPPSAFVRFFCNWGYELRLKTHCMLFSFTPKTLHYAVMVLLWCLMYSISEGISCQKSSFLNTHIITVLPYGTYMSPFLFRCISRSTNRWQASLSLYFSKPSNTQNDFFSKINRLLLYWFPKRFGKQLLERVPGRLRPIHMLGLFSK